MFAIQNAVAQLDKDADVLIPQYRARFWTGTNPVDITNELLVEIDNAVARHPGIGYKEIVLVGHSLGALLVRKAVVYAYGSTEDDGFEPHAARRPWAHLISRVILLAGTNRGWSLDRKGADIGWTTRIGFSLAVLQWRWFRLGGLIHAAARGAPFVANLRLQWMRLARRLGPAFPTTIQLLGDRDDICFKEDNVDVKCCPGFFYRRVPRSGHASIVQFRGPAGETRRAAFEYAFNTPATQLSSDVDAPTLIQDTTTHQVVFIKHGIRDFGHWTTALGQVIVDDATANGVPSKALWRNYRYFPMLGFLLQPERQSRVRQFMDEYTEAEAQYPNARFSFVGHSNGTYILGSALSNYTTMRIHRAVLCGSVLRRDTPWDQWKYDGRVERIQSYIASNDWVVAMFPSVFELLNVSDLGSAGHNGFFDDTAIVQYRYIRGGHGALIDKDNFPSIAAFLNGNDDAWCSEKHRAMDQTAFARYGNRLCWIVWMLLLGLIASLIALPSLIAFPVGIPLSVLIAFLIYGITRTI